MRGGAVVSALVCQSWGPRFKPRPGQKLFGCFCSKRPQSTQLWMSTSGVNSMEGKAARERLATALIKPCQIILKALTLQASTGLGLWSTTFYGMPSQLHAATNYPHLSDEWHGWPPAPWLWPGKVTHPSTSHVRLFLIEIYRVGLQKEQKYKVQMVLSS